MQALSYDFLHKIAEMLQEEEIDIYTMMLYCMSSDDMSYFSEKDRVEVRKIFQVLTDDTRRHAEILKLILDLGGEI